ncbi:dormancy-associated protein 2-like [Vicia villosa]|uniref:dormancy-associated protein 2-like n=1 Tax=Vicia villosa TaxID=3911 RepID=UPI00273C2A57|nr:dormancy-associated protein 2-like [Vicia villosa]
MESKKTIILILGLMAMVLLFSSEVSARVLTEPSSNIKMENIEKQNGGYRGYPMDGGDNVGLGGGFDRVPIRSTSGVSFSVPIGDLFGRKTKVDNTRN